MVKSILIYLMALVSLYGTEEAASKHVGDGMQLYSNENLDGLQASGNIKLEGTVVTGRLQVNGSLKAIDSDLDEVQVNGEVSLQNTHVNKAALINGDLRATDSIFTQELSIAATKMSFDNCTLDSLKVRKFGTRVQQVELSGNTKISGDVTFEMGNGEVILGPNSSISGAVVGGKIRKG